jgi:hypothetical protein
MGGAECLPFARHLVHVRRSNQSEIADEPSFVQAVQVPRLDVAMPNAASGKPCKGRGDLADCRHDDLKRSFFECLTDRGCDRHREPGPVARTRAIRKVTLNQGQYASLVNRNLISWTNRRYDSRSVFVVVMTFSATGAEPSACVAAQTVALPPRPSCLPKVQGPT